MLTIYERFKTNGRRPLPNDLRELLEDFKDARYSNRSITKMTGVGERTLKRVVDRYKYDYPHKRNS